MGIGRLHATGEGHRRGEPSPDAAPWTYDRVTHPLPAAENRLDGWIARITFLGRVGRRRGPRPEHDTQTWDIAMAFGIILLPDDAVRRRFAAYATRVSEESACLMRVGATRPPHVTLAHFDSTRDEAEELWRRLRPSLLSVVTLQPSGVQLAPITPGDFYVPEGGVYCGVEVLRHAGLEEAHGAVRAGLTRLGLSPVGAPARDFRPHVTLAVLPETPAVSMPVPQASLLEAFDARAALGELGPYGTFPRILAER